MSLKGTKLSTCADDDFCTDCGKPVNLTINSPSQEPEDLIEQSEQAIKSLQRHSVIGTCPKSLQYRARARIRADEVFKSDIKRIRSQAEQGIVRTLTRFHRRQKEKHRIALKWQKRCLAPVGTKAAQGTAVNKFQSKELAHSATSKINIKKQSVLELAENIQEKFVKFNELLLNVQESFNKDVEQYTCLLTELHNINKGQGVNNKKNEGQIQLDNMENHRPLAEPMIEQTSRKVQQLITVLYNEHHIDEMAKKWLCQTPNLPRIPIFYTLTKIHKPTPVGRPIISGVSGPTEKLSAFVDKLLQPIAQQQKSYLKDTTDFINFIERTKVPENAILLSMDVTSLYTNIPQEEGIQTVCEAYNAFYKDTPPIPTLVQTLRLILQESSFQFCGKNYLQTHGTAMGTKMGVAFANIFMGKVETESLAKAHPNLSLGNDISTTFSPSGIPAERF